MKPRPRTKNDFPSGLAGRLDAVCDRFEAEFKAGRRPRLEDFLRQVEAADQPALLQELLGIELHHRRRRGDQIIAREYRQRLPAHQAEVTAAFTRVRSAATVPPAAALPQVRGYELLELLGAGGMGQVYKARHRLMKRIVAVKLIRKECLTHPTAVRRFQREVQAAAKLLHPNIVLAYDADQAGATHFFVMEYVQGKDLRQVVKERGPLPVSEACDYIAQAAHGLQHAYENGLVHRDIKPGNLIVDSRGVLKILDLGLARLTEDTTLSNAMTQEGALLGTVDFMAPEQTRQASKVDIRADLYSLGCTFYYLLTGKVPFPGNTTVDKVMKHAEQEPTPLTELRPDVPPAVAAIVRKLMAKDPDQRYPTPAALSEALTSVKGAKQRPHRRLVPWLLVAVCLTMGLAVALFLVRPLWPRSPVDQELEQLLTPSSEQTAHPELWRDAILAFCLKHAGTPQAYEAGKRLPTLPRWENTVRIRFAPIPPGIGLMGSPADEPGRKPDGREGPQHEVEITRPFYLGVYPVTVGQFKAFVQATGYVTEAEKDGGAHVLAPGNKWPIDPKANWKNPGFKQLDSYPVVCVSWNDAHAFCDWLSKKEGKHYTLPTEAQWEYSCRSGSRTSFYFGDNEKELGKYAWYNANAENKTHPVGLKEKNAWGLHDMIGNVRQWCEDCYDMDYYQSSPLKDPTGPLSGTSNLQNRVARGGTWSSQATDSRSAFRLSHPPSVRANHRGFRVVLLLESPGDVRP